MNHSSCRGFVRVLSKAALAGILVVGVTGCVLRLTGGFAFTDDLGTFIRFIFDDVSTAYCRELVDVETGDTFVECDYAIITEDGATQRTSTTQLVSEFGVFGLLVDPVIVQVPASATFGIATVDDGSGPQNLRITETTAFDVTPGVQSTAEPDQKFWIIELPLAIEATLPTQPNTADLDYVFEYMGPPEPSGFATFKAIYAGRVETNGDTFYIPLYPCTGDFSQVPEIEVPVGSNPGGIPLGGFIFNLLFQFGNSGTLGNLGCVNEVYDFTPVVNQPLACDVDGDNDVDRDDLGQIFAARNRPAAPADPRDNDGDGIITVLDARQCVLNCTRPRCAVN